MQDYADYLDSVLAEADKKVVHGNFAKNKKHIANNGKKIINIYFILSNFYKLKKLK